MHETTLADFLVKLNKLKLNVIKDVVCQTDTQSIYNKNRYRTVIILYMLTALFRKTIN